MNKAIFLDKDGTLIHDLPYNIDPAKITWQEGVFEALQALSDKDYLLVIITNQSGVARGFFEEKELEVLKEAMKKTLLEKQIPLAGFYYCPHHREGKIAKYAIECDCRKPKEGMILKAAADLNIDLSASWVIGDTLSDIEAGNRAGCKTILVGSSVKDWVATEARTPFYITTNILQAAGVP